MHTAKRVFITQGIRLFADKTWLEYEAQDFESSTIGSTFSSISGDSSDSWDETSIHIREVTSRHKLSKTPQLTHSKDGQDDNDSKNTSSRSFISPNQIANLSPSNHEDRRSIRSSKHRLRQLKEESYRAKSK